MTELSTRIKDILDRLPGEAFAECSFAEEVEAILRAALSVSQAPEQPQVEPLDTYAPLMWVSMNEDQRYEEYIRVRQIAAALSGVSQAAPDYVREIAAEIVLHVRRGVYDTTEVARLLTDRLRGVSQAPPQAWAPTEKGFQQICDVAAANLARAESAEAKYHELLYAVGNKHEGESRHETALRYIKQAETSGGPASALPTPPESGK